MKHLALVMSLLVCLLAVGQPVAEYSDPRDRGTTPDPGNSAGGKVSSRDAIYIDEQTGWMFVHRGREWLSLGWPDCSADPPTESPCVDNTYCISETARAWWCNDGTWAGLTATEPSSFYCGLDWDGDGDTDADAGDLYACLEAANDSLTVASDDTGDEPGTDNAVTVHLASGNFDFCDSGLPAGNPCPVRTPSNLG